jgi:hypothetical protein
MIQVAGNARRTFAFPADLPTAFAYYSDVSRVLGYLPHIVLVRAFSYDQYRMLYDTVELGVYHIRIFCDIQTRLVANGKQNLIRISPLTGVTPVEPHANLRAVTAQGAYTSTSTLHREGDRTEVEYSMALQARLPTPLGLRMMPGSMVDAIASNIAHARIHEIINGFVERSVEAFPYWLEEMVQPRRRKSRAT